MSLSSVRGRVKAPASQQRTPPGPHSLSPLKSTLAFQRDPIPFLTTLARQYGDIVQFRLGIWPVYFLNHPAYLKHVMQENNQNYNKDVLLFRILQPLLGNGLITASGGDFWLRQRRLIQPAFHKQHIATLGNLLVTESLEMLARWERSSTQGQPLQIDEEMVEVTLSMVGKALFSRDIGEASNTFGQAFTYTNRVLSDYFHLPFPPLRFPTARNLRFWAALRTMDTIVYDLIRQHRQRSEEYHDLLSTLLQAVDEETGQGMSNQQIRDEVITLLVAGHETSASALTWLWYELSQHPTVEARLHAELDEVLAGRLPTVDDLPRLLYTRKIIDETLRLYPPGWVLMRNTLQDDEIGGYQVPAKTFILFSPYLVHRHPAFWENADDFDPDRFLPEQVTQRPRYAYIPFGNGPRICIGQSFALLEITLLVATVAQRYRLTLMPGHRMEQETLLTLRAGNGLPMYLQRRSPADGCHDQG